MQSLTPNETDALERIELDPMLAQVQTWAAVNSGSGNLTGLGTTAGLLAIGAHALDRLRINELNLAGQRGKTVGE